MESKQGSKWFAACGWMAFLSTLLAWALLSHPHSLVPVDSPYDPAKEKLIILDAENNLLKQMLGQVPGRVVILAPSPNGGTFYGKLVWDEARQVGFITTSPLPTPPPGKVFKVFIRAEKQFYSQTKALSPTEDGRLQCMFEINKPVFKATEFRVAIDSPAVATPPQDYLLLGR